LNVEDNTMEHICYKFNLLGKCLDCDKTTSLELLYLCSECSRGHCFIYGGDASLIAHPKKKKGFKVLGFYIKKLHKI
jgi:hypothetical protein